MELGADVAQRQGQTVASFGFCPCLGCGPLSGGQARRVIGLMPGRKA